MNIAILVQYFKTGGMETFILRLSRYLIVHGHVVTVISTYDKGEMWAELENNKIQSLHFNIFSGTSPITQAIKLANHLKKNKFDVILLNNEKYSQSILNLLTDNIIAIPIIHNDADFAYRTGIANSNAWNVAVGVSTKVCEQIKSRVPGRHVVHIDYGVELPKESSYLSRNKYTNQLKLIYVGRIEHVQKGVLLLPEIIDKCLQRDLNVSLMVIGEGSDLAALICKCNKSNLSSHVSFIASLPSSEIYDALLTHHVLLMPSFFEGLGIIALEAQACGCVPIASRLDGVTDHSIEHDVTGLLTESGNTDQIVDAIVSLYNDPAKWNSMSSAGHSRVGKEFSADSTGKAYIALFNDALNGKYPLPRPRRKYYPIDFYLMTWKDFVPNVLRKIRRGFKRS